MKKIFKILKATIALLFLTITFIACDKDFTSIESDIEGATNFNTNSEKSPVIAYNKMLNAVQTNGLSSNLLGVYKDDVYGETTASIIAQITPASYDPDFGFNAVIDSVMLTIPYFSTNEGENDSGGTEYLLTEEDSLFGGGEVKLSIYRNNYFLRNFDPENIEELQTYYSNGNNIDFDSQVGELLYEDTNYFPSSEEIDIELSDEEEELIAPSLYVNLNELSPDFWKDLLKIDQTGPHSELSNSNNFKDYFRGLYFKAEAIADSNGHLQMLDFSNAKIVVKYTTDGDELDEDGMPERERETLQFNFTGNRFNLFQNDTGNTIIADADAAANTVDGDETLYLKGGEGSMAIIDLFGGPDVNGSDDDDELSDNYEDFIATYKDKRLINEANLVFHVDQDAGLNKDQEPNRILIYDLKNNIPIVDYFFDFTDSTNPENSKVLHSTVLERDSDDNGIKYKIRLTEHLNNILLKDSTNLKLGVMVTTNINEIFQSNIYNTNDEEKVTSGEVLSSKGTVLYGSNENVTEDKRLQLEIFYSCLKEDGDCPEE